MELVIGLPILIFSSILHEIAHGYVADRLGDPTARLMGRLTLNPLKHIDPLWSILIPALLFLGGSRVIIGGAKPVPTDPFNLKDGRKDVALVALVGPITNLAITLVATGIFKLLPMDIATNLLGIIIYQVIWLNLLLAVFNLIPIPPLDGSKVFSLLLPEDLATTYLSFAQMGMFLLFALLYFSGLGSLLVVIIVAILRILGLPLLF